ncbi:MAG: hypothetical protein IPK10_13465 [Bacteroidetes bacterium]|nr:hypothetical protein [Bacteroidota bacterium]
MKLKVLIFSLLSYSTQVLSQDLPTKESYHQKGKFFIYFGWNRAWYTNSDISFNGANYDFTLQNVEAKDLPSPLAADPYLNPSRFTIPQYNLRVGYFFSEHWSISFGDDHMKYVMQQNQTVKINGGISDTVAHYEGLYSNEDITLTSDFLQFEHTDGLNYLNFELRRFDNILKYKKLKLNITEGFGMGTIMPRTNTTLLSKERYDQFHFAGYGVGALIGLNLTINNWFFIQSELKGGYINMPDIRTTKNKIDQASQHFFFTQFNFELGANINLKKKRK